MPRSTARQFVQAVGVSLAVGLAWAAVMRDIVLGLAILAFGIVTSLGPRSEHETVWSRLFGTAVFGLFLALYPRYRHLMH